MCHLARLSFACAKVAPQHAHHKVDQRLLVVSSSCDPIRVPRERNWRWRAPASRCLAFYDFDPLEPLEASARLWHLPNRPRAMSTFSAPRTAVTESLAYHDPVERAAVRRPLARTTATAAPLVLVVDDHEDSRIIARLVLEAAGFRVREAANGVTGLSLATALEPSVMLLDLILPGIDGWEVARRLRRDPATTGIGIIAVTALAVRDDHVRARHAGCDTVLTKPVLPKAIVETVCRFVERPLLVAPALFQV